MCKSSRSTRYSGAYRYTVNKFNEINLSTPKQKIYYQLQTNFQFSMSSYAWTDA